MVEKLSKALEGLKNLQFTNSSEEPNISKKEKMFFCVLAADVMVSLKAQGMHNLPVVIENMINLCDDKDSDVRMVAEESLNRVIMVSLAVNKAFNSLELQSLSQSNMLKVQVELHNIIKKNGPARCLRAALTKFGQLSRFIRPNKGKGHVQMLIPALVEIAKREEESIHETLTSSFENIFRVLGVFVQDNALKGLIKSFLHNLSSSNAVIRRCSASCIITIVQYCRKPIIFNCYVLNSLLDCIVPVCEDNSTDLILGVLGCLRILLPALVCMKNEEGISGSFGVRRRRDESLLSVDRLIQVYELCLHYTGSKDHNVVAAALETLNQILQNPPHLLESFFLSPSGFSRSYIQSSRENKFRSRSGSEMSVAMSSVDEVLLLDDNDLSSNFSTLSLGNEFQTKQSSSKPNTAAVYSDDVKGVENPFKEKSFDKLGASQPALDADSDTESAVSELSASTNFLMRIETEEKEVGEEELDRSRSNSRDYLYSPTDSDRVASADLIDVGTFTDTAVPLIFCARHIAASFLLDGSPGCLKSDRTIRVSIKSLALSCLSAIVKLYPVIMKMNLAKGQTESCPQGMSDVLLYCDHSDPVIRGNLSVLVGSFMNSALNDSKNFTSAWLSGNDFKLNSTNLIGILFKGLQDKSSVCTRQSLTALKLCVTRALFSVYNTQFMPLLEYLPALACNSYWLVKVKLMEVLSDLPYLCISDLSESDVYQEEVIDCVMLPLLGDEDARVRRATAEALVRIIPVLHNGKWTVSEYGKSLSEYRSDREEKRESSCLPFSGFPSDPDESTEYSLSMVVAKLTYSLLVPKTKHFLFGHLEALKLLSEKYPTTVYSKGWNCARPQGTGLNTSLIAVVLSLVLTSPFGSDLGAFSNASLLLGNLFAGLAISCLKGNDGVLRDSSGECPDKLWSIFRNESVSLIAEEILSHSLKVLNLYSRLLEEVTLSSVADSSPAPTLLPLLSPIKKQEKKSEEKAEEKKAKAVGAQKQSAQYAKLEHLLKNAYTNHKVSLDKAAGDNFFHLLESTLFTLSVLLEVATVRETGRCAEEILSYLLPAVLLCPSPAVLCVMQLLKSLFGTNFPSCWEEELSALDLRGLNLFDIFFHLPTESLSEKIRRRADSNAPECHPMSDCGRRPNRKIPLNRSDKQWLATYIRLFEPVVVKSLQLYTITGDVELQSNVLRLLNQLVELRVNYCLLDGKQIFLDFVLKQFELIEHGQIPGVEALLPCIFRFLILLSYEKQHSKPIMGIPKILQLCDGLMASDQPVQTHCIPALAPVVADIFFSRSPVPSSVEEKELETQREVLFSMLLRLSEFPEVMDMVGSILRESRAVRGKERWKRWSRQVVDSLVPLLSQDRLRVDTPGAQKSLSELMSSLSLNVLRPINPLVKALFVEAGDYSCPTSLSRWLSKVTVLLETVLFVKEDALLNRLEETSPNVNLTSLLPTGSLDLMDPFHVKSFFRTYPASETVARFILKVISVVSTRICDSSSSSEHLQQKLSTFFVCTFHMLKSGTFHSIANSLRGVLRSEPDSLARICFVFQSLIHVCPLLTCQFSYFLTLLNYCDRTYWTEIVRRPLTLSGKLVQSCGVLSLCDHLCDDFSDKDTLNFLLDECFQELLLLSHEIPVQELFVTMHARSDWPLLLQAASSRSFDLFPPRLVEKLLRLLEITESSHSGALLKLLLEKFLGSSRLALSLLAASIASRQAEHLLTLPREKVSDQISQRDLRTAVNALRSKTCLKRHAILWSLLEKLSAHAFDSSLADADADASELIEAGELGEEWYFGQVKRICCREYVVGLEVPYMLWNLSFERICQIMSCADFNLKILKDCLPYDTPVGKGPQMKQKDRKNEKPKDGLFEASRLLLLRKVTEVREVLQGARREAGGGSDWSEAFEKSCSRAGFEEQFWEICHCLGLFLRLLSKHRLAIESEWAEGIAELALLCLKMMEWKIRREEGEVHPKNIEIGLRCWEAVLASRELGNSLSVQENVGEYVSGVTFVIGHLVPRCRLSKILGDRDLASAGHSEQLDFLLDFVAAAKDHALLPNYLIDSLRDVVVGLCRVPAMSSRVLAVAEGCDMQDIGFLKNFISRFSLIGWRTRHQFEEIWVALLSALGFSSQGDLPQEENAFIVQVSAVAVEGITALLKSTLLDWTGRRLIHHGRDCILMRRFYEGPPTIFQGEEWEGAREYQFLDNLEMSGRDERFVSGLMSVEYLWTGVKQLSREIEVYEEHCKELRSVGLDLPSCIYLLTELYNQWIYQASPSIKMVTASLKSSLVISDLFTDIGQFQWLLNFCLRIDEVVIPEDTVLLPLIVLACCKAVAVVLPSEEVCEKIKKVMLRSKSFPCRLSAVEGLLYLLQSYVVCHTLDHASKPPRTVSNIVDTFLPVALEVVQEFRLQKEPMTDEYERCHWSLIFYLLLHYRSSLGDLKNELLDFIVATLANKTCPASIMALLIRGIQRLALTTGLSRFQEQLDKVSLEIIPHHSMSFEGNGLQLLSVLSFLDKRLEVLIRAYEGRYDRPDRVMREMERLDVLFEKLKRSSPMEAEVVGCVILYVIRQLSAADVLTKVVQEFLLPHQPYQKILSRLVQKVFQMAEQSLLEDWFVFSLRSFVEGLPISMSIWTLNCFFSCASEQPWLRYLLPVVQARVRMAEAEDKKLLCLLGTHFYRQLKTDAHKKSFAQTFEKAQAIDTAFRDLLKAIS